MFRASVGGYLVAVLLKVLLALEDEGVGGVDLVDLLALGLIGGLVGLGLVTHPLDLVLAQSGRSLDTDLLLLAGSLVLCGYVQDTVGIYIEGYLDLRDTAGCGGDAVKVETSDGLVVAGHGALALEDVNLH